jgi:MscS family membrane protein
MKKIILILLYFFIILGLYSENPLTPLKINSPRQTLKIFLDSMNQYKEGIEREDEEKKLKIEIAIKCLDLREISPLVRKEKGKEIAIFLKETIDRVYVPSKDYSEVPEELSNVPVILNWVIPDTEIAISFMENNLISEYKFNSNTILQSKEYYNKTKHLPYLKGSGNGAFFSENWNESFLPKWSLGSFLGLFVWQWIGILLSFLIGIILKKVSKLIIYSTIKFIQKNSSVWDDELINSLSRLLTYAIPFAFWFLVLNFSGIEGLHFTIINFILKVFLGLTFILFLSNTSDLFFDLYLKKRNSEVDKIGNQFVPLLSKTIKAALVSLGFLLSLQNLGVNVISLLAGLGIGGLAIALAAKDTAANLFGSLMIYLDRPFQIGDYIIMGSVEGIVEEIGLRSTRLRTWNDSLVSVPNSTVANSNIDNMAMRRVRRTNTSVTIALDTQPIKIESFLEGIKNILKRNPLVVQDKVLVGFSEFTSYGLQIRLHFYIDVQDWIHDTHEREKIFMEIINLANHISVRFVYPTQTLHIETLTEQTPIPKKDDLSFDDYIQKVKEFAVDGAKAKPGGFGIYKPLYKEILEGEKNGKFII